MSCQIKTIPNDAYYLTGTGNRGGGFPKTSVCGVVAQPDTPVIEPQECYLALEDLNDDLNGPILLVDAAYVGSPPDFLYIGAPCVLESNDCYLALQDNGISPFSLEQAPDYFSTTCLTNV